MTNNAPNTPVPLEIDAPVFRDQDDLVENVYALPGTLDLPDLESQDVMSEYLMDRFEPEEGFRMRIVGTSTRFTMPGVHRVPAGYKEVSRFRKLQEWFISPKQAAAVMLGSAALFNTVGNPGTLDGAARYSVHSIYRFFDPVGDKTVLHRHNVRNPGRVRDINLTADTANRVGSATVDPTVIHEFAQRVHQAESDGASVRQIRIVGNSSDEWGSDNSIGNHDAGNARLGEARAAAAKEALSSEGLHVKPAHILLDKKEHVLSAGQEQAVLRDAHAAGFTSIKEAVSTVDASQKVPHRLAQRIKKLFSSKQDRGVSLSATVEYPGKDTVTVKTTKETVPGVDNAPDVPKPHWYWFIPMVPIRRRERYETVKQVSRWEFTSSQPILRPKILIEQKDQVWLRIRPEAVREDGTLVEHPWAYTRKYEHLLRDNRIADVLSAEYMNPKGEKKSLRIMFVDKSPAAETIEAFEELLRSFAVMEEGKLGDRVSGIFVYPSENAGTEHDDPKRIAMGIDKQSEENILGTFTYALDLVELHMPTTWDPDDLKAMFESFNGPAWVMAHEVGGHGTDESDKTQRLRRVHALGIPQAHIIEGDPRARKMKRLEKVLKDLPGRLSLGRKPIEFDIVYQFQDMAGQLVTRRDRVPEGDPRLAVALQSTVVGRKPTRYAGSNVSEHYAETAAATTTGIVVPYDEASVTIPSLRADNGKPAVGVAGYRPDTRGQQLFTKSVGAMGGSFPAAFIDPPAVKISHINPANDRVIQRQLERTHRVRTLYPAQMVAILARVTRAKR